MYDINRKQYIIKQSTGKVLNIFYKENKGICLSVLNKRNSWSDSVLLMKDTQPDFDACIDDLDNIHILCQDKHGNIVHLFSTNNNWDSRTVLNTRYPSTYNKHLKILCLNKEIYFFFAVEHSGKKILAYQAQGDLQNVSNPKVIDYIIGGKTPYCVTKDINNNIYIFYRFLDTKYNQVGYKKYIPSKGRLSDFSPITGYNGDSDVLSTAADYKNNLHVCWQKASPQKYELIYSRKRPDAENWDEEKTLSTSTDSFINCSLLVAEEKVIVYWIKDSGIIYCVSENNGDTWSMPESYPFSISKHLYCFVYKTNVPDECGNMYINELPGSYSGGYKLAFMDDFIPRAENEGSCDIKGIINDRLESLSRNITEIKQSIKDLSKKMEDLESKQSQIIIERNKHNMESGVTGNDLSKIKSELEALRKVIEDREAKSIKENAEEKKESVEIKEEKDNKKNTGSKAAGLLISNGGEEESKPVMPGAGFSHITPAYLRGLHNK